MAEARRNLFVDFARTIASKGALKTDDDNNFTGYAISELFLAADKHKKVVPLGILFKAFELTFIILPKGELALLDDETHEAFTIDDANLESTLHDFLAWRINALKQHQF